jgi:hypothetical protein
MDCRFIRRYCLLFFLSETRPTLLENGPSVHPTVPWFPPSVPTRLTLLENGPSVHSTVPWFSPSVPTRATIAPTLAI